MEHEKYCVLAVMGVMGWCDGVDGFIIFKLGINSHLEFSFE
jgi:hypothetical protein